MRNITVTLKIHDPELAKMAEGTEFSYDVDGMILLAFPVGPNAPERSELQEGADLTPPEKPFGFMGGNIDVNVAAATILGIPEIGKIVFGTAMRTLLEKPMVTIDPSELPDEVREVMEALIRHQGEPDENEAEQSPEAAQAAMGVAPHTIIPFPVNPKSEPDPG